jgi:hypothetical protein
METLAAAWPSQLSKCWRLATKVVLPQPCGAEMPIYRHDQESACESMYSKHRGAVGIRKQRRTTSAGGSPGPLCFALCASSWRSTHW